MNQEIFKKLYETLSENNPTGEFEYNGDDIISHEIRKGIWLNILNHSDDEDKDAWGWYYELRNANAKLWDRHISEIDEKRQNITEYVQYVIDEIASHKEQSPHSISVRLTPKDILRLDLRYFSYGGGMMAFGIERHERNFVTERLLSANLKCFGDFKILGYSIYKEEGKICFYDIYHTDFPEEDFDSFLRKKLDVDDYDEVFIDDLGCDQYDQYYDDEF